MQNNVMKCLAYLYVDTFHQTRMISASDIQKRGAPNAVFFGQTDGHLDFGPLPRNHDLSRRIQIRNVNVGRRSKCTGRRFVAPDHRRHRAHSCLTSHFHELSALLDEP